MTLDLCPLEESGLSSTQSNLVTYPADDGEAYTSLDNNGEPSSSQDTFFSPSHVVLLHGQCRFKCQRFPVTLNLSLQRLTSHIMPLENISMMQVLNLQ